MDKQLPAVSTLDTATPATRLLEKRRQMYESLEKFAVKRKEYNQQELQFKVKERELRE
jgi:shikimate kinase